MNRRQRRSMPSPAAVSSVDAALARMVRNGAPSAVEAVTAAQGVVEGLTECVDGLSHAIASAERIEAFRPMCDGFETARTALAEVLAQIEASLP